MNEDQAWELVKNTPAYRGVCEYLGKSETDVKLREAIFDQIFPYDIQECIDYSDYEISGWFTWDDTEDGNGFWARVNAFLEEEYDDEASQNEIPV